MAYVTMTLDGATNRVEHLNLVGADGTTKYATLTPIVEDSDKAGAGDGIGMPVTGITEIKARNTAAIDMEIGEFDTNNFFVVIQLVQTGVYAVSGNAESALTMDDVVTARTSSTWELAYLIYASSTLDASTQYQQDLPLSNAIRGGITSANKTSGSVKLDARLVQSYENGVLRLGNLGYSTGMLNAYHKYMWTVYPLK